MSESIELSTLNLRYEAYRLRDDAREARLLASIAERGVEEPLEGVDTPEGRFLLNGFKRYRCARKLEIHCASYVSLGGEEATGIVNLMRSSTNRCLTVLEQARFVCELLTVHGMSPAEVAATLARSAGWVSMRRRLLAAMSPATERFLFQGAFPVYCYMYSLSRFRRMKSVSQADIEQFVKSVAGKGLSVRDIELLAHGYFRGPASLANAIREGKLLWSLEQMKNVPEDMEGCSEFERVLLGDLQLLQKYMQRVVAKSEDPQLKGRAFHAQANLLLGSLLSSLDHFQERMKDFHARTGTA